MALREVALCLAGEFRGQALAQEIGERGEFARRAVYFGSHRGRGGFDERERRAVRHAEFRREHFFNDLDALPAIRLAAMIFGEALVQVCKTGGQGASKIVGAISHGEASART